LFQKIDMTAPNLEQIDSLLRLVDREVWLVTARAADRRSALTATWISQVSLDRERPVLLAGLSPRNFTTELISQSGLFAAHLVPHELLHLAYRFAASSGRHSDKLAGVALREHPTGALLLTECRAWFVCRQFHALTAGDRVFCWGDIVDAGEHAVGPPLREQAFIQGLTGEERNHLKGLREADALHLRPSLQQWREQNLKK
jgi:flavin reductase (DIM6/NTAB) family NADH-FMN oxidoreductase RutF